MAGDSRPRYYQWILRQRLAMALCSLPRWILLLSDCTPDKHSPCKRNTDSTDQHADPETTIFEDCHITLQLDSEHSVVAIGRRNVVCQNSECLRASTTDGALSFHARGARCCQVSPPSFIPGLMCEVQTERLDVNPVILRRGSDGCGSTDVVISHAGLCGSDRASDRA